jgi:hypothetical protein
MGVPSDTKDKIRAQATQIFAFLSKHIEHKTPENVERSLSKLFFILSMSIRYLIDYLLLTVCSVIDDAAT